MAVIAALVFLVAIALIAVVFAMTLVPALPNIRRALSGMPITEARVVTVTPRRTGRTYPMAAGSAERRRAAA